MTTGRRLWAGLQLLDRQMVDRDGRMAGCVDDLELTSRSGGDDLYVTAILSGPGALAQRMGRTRFGAWLRRSHALVAPVDGDPARIDFVRVVDIASHVTLSVDHDELASASAERWVRDHVIAHIPGSGHAPE